MSSTLRELYLGSLLYLWLLSAISNAIDNDGIFAYSKAKSLQMSNPLKKYIYRRDKVKIKPYDTMATILPRVPMSPFAPVKVAQSLIQGRTPPDSYDPQTFSASAPYGYDSPYGSSSAASYGSYSPPSSYDSSDVAYESAYAGQSEYSPYSSYYGQETSYDPSSYFPGYVSSGTPHGTQSEQSPVAASHFYTGYSGSAQAPSTSQTGTSSFSELEPLANHTLRHQLIFSQG